MKKLTVIVRVNDGREVDVAQAIDDALTDVVFGKGASDWTIENEQGQSFVFDATETGGDFQ